MTEEQILELASKYLELHPIHGDESVWDEWSGKPEDLLKFAREIRKQTIDEILTSLKEVPNPDANRTAINRIRSI